MRLDELQVYIQHAFAFLCVFVIISYCTIETLDFFFWSKGYKKMLNRRGLIKGFFGGLVGSTVVDGNEWRGWIEEQTKSPYIPEPIKLNGSGGIDFVGTGYMPPSCSGTLEPSPWRGGACSG